MTRTLFFNKVFWLFEIKIYISHRALVNTDLIWEGDKRGYCFGRIDDRPDWVQNISSDRYRPWFCLDCGSWSFSRL